MANKKDKAVPQKPVPRLNTMPALAQHAYRQMGVMVPQGTQPEHLENPLFWENVARRLLAGDEIRCMAEDGSFVAYTVVTFVSGNDARVKVTSFTELGEIPDIEEGSDYKVMNGGIAGFYIKDKRDGTRLFDRYWPTHKEATQALEGHLKALAA